VTIPRWHEEPVAKRPKREAFDCGDAAQEVGGVALLIDAKNESVANWYASYGALRLLDTPLSLLLPLATIKAALESAGKL